jgi:alginate O-acetyltransferase complex protein AlgI
MSFLSPEFGVVLALGFALFHLCPPKYRPHVLLGLSYAFYLTWSAFHALLLFSLTAAVYVATRMFERRRAEVGTPGVITLSVTLLLVVLAAFKCGAWLSETMLAVWGRGTIAASALLVAPLGLSYYIFKMVGYLLDVYWEKVPVQRRFVPVALYFSFFPQIVSGPIQRAGDFFRQLESLDRPDADRIVGGLRRILFGVFKKVVIADIPAVLVSRVHANPSAYSPLELLLGAYCFAFQLYVDFSSVTDIAIGIGQLFGVTGPENFNRPYFAANVQDFWRRWHMSLTTWLTDYLFLPLRMAFRGMGQAGLCTAIFVNMLAIGVWHGPRLTYLAFGALNGVFMILSALTLKRRNAWFQNRPWLKRARQVAGPVLTFNLIALAFIFFRAHSLTSAIEYVAHLIPGAQSPGVTVWHVNWLTRTLAAQTFLSVAAIEMIEWVRREPAWAVRFLTAPPWLRWSVYYAGIVLIFLATQATRGFIYAQF